MTFTLRFTREAADSLKSLEASDALKLKRVRKAIGLLQTDPKYPSLQSHKYESMRGLNGEDVWDSYVENKTHSAWRIFWHYGPDTNMITIVAITPHP